MNFPEDVSSTLVPNEEGPDQLSTEPFDHWHSTDPCDDPDWSSGRERVYVDENQYHAANLTERASKQEAGSVEADIELELEDFERQMSSLGITPFSLLERSSVDEKLCDEHQLKIHGSPSSSGTPANEMAFQQHETPNEEHRTMITTVIHRAYEKIHDAVPQDLVTKMRLAMADIPESVEGLNDCKRHLTQKEYYTLLDMLVVQYILNDGILLRQRHDTSEEYHVDVGGGWNVSTEDKSENTDD